MLRNVFYKPRLLSTLASGALLVFLMLPLFASAQVGAAIERGLAEVLWSVVTTVFGWMVGIGGGLLDSAVTNYVVGFGELYRTSGLGFSIDSLWSTVRDIFNLTFIFGLVYIGFKMIFNSGDSSAKRMLGSLVLAALLVNFSLFITKMIIDFSNLAAAQFALAFSTSPGVYSVSSGFMQLFGLTRGFDALPEGAGFTYIFGMLFLFLIAAFVFAAGGLLLIIRFVVLNFYMILSPLMFLGMVFPGMRGVSSKYWEGFLSRAFFAPAYLLMLYFAHQVLVNMQGVATAGNANLASAFSNEGATRYDAATSIIPFFIIIGAFLIASLVVAQKMGAEGATNAIAVGKRMSGGARKYAQRKSGDVTFGAAGAAGRNTVGRVANRAANSDTLNRWAAKSSIAASGLKASSALADSSFDGRRVAGLGKSFGIGEGSKSGYASNIKAKQKADAEFAKGLSENKIVRGVDGKIVDDKDGKIQAQLDKDKETQRNNAETEYGYANKKFKEAQLKERQAKEAAKVSLDKTETSRKEVERLKKENDAAIMAGDGQKSEVLDEKIRLEELNLKNLESENKATQANLVAAEKLSKKAEAADAKAAKAAEESAESKITYANQLAFMARREKEAVRWQSKTAAAGAAIIGAGAGAVAGSAFGPVGTVIGATVGAFAGPIASTSKGARYREGAAELKKQYGTDGTVKKNASKKEKELKILSEQLKESGGDSKPESADEEK